jgi:uncharacterized phage protein (TIGR02220 family)
MAASVRIEDEAFSDVRYDVLATLCLLADPDHARGKMAVLWRQCTAQGTYVLSESVVRAVLGANASCGLLESGLAEASDGGFRIKGTRGRIEWLRKLRKNAQKGGKAKAAKRQTQGKQEAAKSLPPPFPPAPAPAPAQEEDKSVSGKPDPGVAFAETAIALINRHAGTKYRPTSDSVLKLVKALIKNRHTPEQAEQVIASKRGWIGDPKMGQFFRPSTLLAATNFANYLDELEAGPSRPTGTLRQSSERPESRSPMMAAFDDEVASAAP